jgi:hypothetical protein
MLKKGSPVGKSKSVWESPNFIESISPTYKFPFDGIGLGHVGSLTLSSHKSDKEIMRDLPKCYPLSPGQLNLLFGVQSGLVDDNDPHKLISEVKKCNLLYMQGVDQVVFSIKIDQALVSAWRKEARLPGSQIWLPGTKVFFNIATRSKV